MLVLQPSQTCTAARNDAMHLFGAYEIVTWNLQVISKLGSDLFIFNEMFMEL